MSCQQSPNLTISPCRSAFIFLVGAFECLLFGGTVFGWPQLVHLLKMDNVYADLCGDVNTAGGDGINQYKPVVYGGLFNNSRCSALNVTPVFLTGHKVGVEQCVPQDEMFALIFTIAVFCYGVPGILVGLLLHYAGLWATRISAGAMLTLGFVFLGATTKEYPEWLFPAIILLALGGNQIRMSALQLADLFPTHKATAITLLTAMYTMSASLFLVFQLAERYRLERAMVCWVLAGAATFIVWMSFPMPSHHIPCHEYEDIQYKGGSPYTLDELNPLEMNNQASEHWISKADVDGDQRNRNPNYRSNPNSRNTPENEIKLKEFEQQSIFTTATSLSSFLHQLWFFINLFAINIYQMTFNYWITIVSCTMKEAETFSVVYSYVNIASIFVAPAFGVYVDYLISKARRTGKSFRDRRTKEIQSNIVPLLVTTIATLLMYLCLLFFHPIAVYASLACMTVARPCVVAVSTAYLRIRFPVEHFNRMVGLHCTITTLLLLLQYPLFKWSLNMYLPAHGTVLILIALSLLNPLHLLLRPLFNKTLGNPKTQPVPVLTNGRL